ncbi:MAG TPA: DNA gyrase subunit A [Candidatus Goldiibacteriota bacterium]|nr:DNA gyrase subunit A [Candidatus Goldiibacteriota bacterium]HPN64131.1 DNA gyrase subunit A [Candidatus Goldiibacteriota bacterium]HRQ43982.1 DNA gyrase subunit A [Candidatus Goldiibacteriota bacterium]
MEEELKPVSKVIQTAIEEEIKTSYLDYSMSVIIGRALPDIRDGLKPVHRRVLYGLHDMGLYSNKPYRKSAKIVGEVMGNYHPHGDSSIYDTMVRMAQPFVFRMPLIDGQGNFGSVDGDPPAAMRYTEARLSKFAEELLKDLDKDTVDFVPNYDESTKEPTVLPVSFPHLLVNGSSGIAVGMATNIPPHNLGEVIDAVVMMIDNKNTKIEELMGVIKGPDFPTGAFIIGKEGIKQAYTTGRGSVVMQSKVKIEETKKGKKQIVITELPYMVNKANLLETIAGLVKDKKIEGISDLRDESDKDGTRAVIEVSRSDNPEIILNQLYKHTQMRASFGIIMLAIVDGRPKVLNIKEFIENFIQFRKQVIIRRIKFELDKAEKRAHILEGLKIALKYLDRVIKIIRGSSSTEEARVKLIEAFKLSVIQAQAILDMKLQQLTNLEVEKIENEYKELLKLIEHLKSLLASEKKILDLMKSELLEVRKKYADERRTQIVAKEKEMTMEDLIQEEDMVVTITHNGFIKRTPVSAYKAQKRGGRGIIAMETKEEDFIEDLFVSNTHEYLMFFTSKGRCHWLKVYEIPEGARQTRGKAIVNLIKLEEGETVAAYVSVKTFDQDKFLIMSTESGLIKRSNLSLFGNPRSGGIIAIGLNDDDRLIDTKIASEKDEIFIATKEGMAIRTKVKQFREIGRTGMGVRGINLNKKDKVVSMTILASDKKDSTLLTVTEKGFGKRTKISEYREQSRGGKGLISIKVTDKTGEVVAIKLVEDPNELMIITNKGTLIRTKIKDIKTIGRNTQGVRLIKLKDAEKVSAVARVAEEDDEEAEG